MLTTLRIQNFRGFKDLTLGTVEHPLKRVNLIAGKNNSGKTAVLEAILLHRSPASPGLSVEIHRFRGLEQPFSAVEPVTRWLFYGGKRTDAALFTSTDASGASRVLEIRVIDAETSRDD